MVNSPNSSSKLIESVIKFIDRTTAPSDADRNKTEYNDGEITRKQFDEFFKGQNTNELIPNLLEISGLENTPNNNLIAKLTLSEFQQTFQNTDTWNQASPKDTNWLDPSKLWGGDRERLSINDIKKSRELAPVKNLENNINKVIKFSQNIPKDFQLASELDSQGKYSSKLIQLITKLESNTSSQKIIKVLQYFAKTDFSPNELSVKESESLGLLSLSNIEKLLQANEKDLKAFATKINNISLGLDKLPQDIQFDENLKTKFFDIRLAELFGQKLSQNSSSGEKTIDLLQKRKK